MAPFETLAEVMEIYQLPQDDFLAELTAAIGGEKAEGKRQK
jgi:hypothetical protein